jgi:hypothetical protein
MNLPTLPTLLSAFFLRYLAVERGVSPHTSTSYRDAIKLLFPVVGDNTGAGSTWQSAAPAVGPRGTPAPQETPARRSKHSIAAR